MPLEFNRRSGRSYSTRIGLEEWEERAAARMGAADRRQYEYAGDIRRTCGGSREREERERVGGERE